jgi:S1-C subfamily serine protease
VNLLDLILLAAFAVAAVGGYRLGFLARVASWIGLGIGLFVAARLLPTLLDAFSGPDPAAKFFLAGGILISGAFLGQALGLILGHMVRRAIPVGPAAAVDRAVGAVVGLLGVTVMVWFLTPAMADVPGNVARQARTSVIARGIAGFLPQPPDTLQTLRSLVGDNRFPQVFESLKPAPEVGPPPSQLSMSVDLVDHVKASTVKVSGIACRRIQEGSGFAIAPDTIVTNAHVVAGERSTEVLRPDGRTLKAVVVLFDSDRDLAILRVAGLGQQPLPVTSAKVGENGAVFGHPNGQTPLRVAPAAIRQRVDARGRDLYDSHATSRDVWILAADLHPGDSGSALTDTRGDVVGVAFAIAPDKPGTSYALTYKELTGALAEPRQPAGASTGPCLTHG